MFSTTFITSIVSLLAFGAADPIAPPIHSAPAPVVATDEVPAPVIVFGAEDGSVIPGVTRPARSATLGVPFDGLIAELPVVEGTRVRKGDIIALLDDRVARQALLVSEADAAHDAAVIRARAVLERATDALRRSEAARAAGAMNEERFEEARHRRDVADADLRFAQETLEKARIQLELTRAQLEEHRIRAPFDGVVVRVHAEAGEVLSPGEPLADLLTLDRALTDIHLPAERALGLRTGDLVALQLAKPIDAVVAARVRYAEPRVDPTSRATRVVFEFEPASFTIPAGVLVTPAARAPDATDADRLASLADRSTATAPFATAATASESGDPAVAVAE